MLSCLEVKFGKSGQMIFNQIIIVKVSFRCNFPSPCLAGLIKLVQKSIFHCRRTVWREWMGKAKEGFEVDMMRLIDKIEVLAIFGMEEKKQLADRRFKYLERKRYIMMRKKDDCLPIGYDVVTCNEHKAGWGDMRREEEILQQGLSLGKKRRSRSKRRM